MTLSEFAVRIVMLLLMRRLFIDYVTTCVLLLLFMSRELHYK